MVSWYPLGSPQKHSDYENHIIHERGGLMEELIAAKGVKGSLEEKWKRLQKLR